MRELELEAERLRAVDLAALVEALFAAGALVTVQRFTTRPHAHRRFIEVALRPHRADVEVAVVDVLSRQVLTSGKGVGVLEAHGDVLLVVDRQLATGNGPTEALCERHACGGAGGQVGDFVRGVLGVGQSNHLRSCGGERAEPFLVSEKSIYIIMTLYMRYCQVSLHSRYNGIYESNLE